MSATAQVLSLKEATGGAAAGTGAGIVAGGGKGVVVIGRGEEGIVVAGAVGAVGVMAMTARQMGGGSTGDWE